MIKSKETSLKDRNSTVKGLSQNVFFYNPSFRSFKPVSAYKKSGSRQ